MTDVPAETTEASIARLEASIARLEALGLEAPSTTSVNPDGSPGHVAPGELIESAWGNAVSDEFQRKRAWFASSIASVGFNTSITDFPGLTVSLTMAPGKAYLASAFVPSIVSSGAGIFLIYISGGTGTTLVTGRHEHAIGSGASFSLGASVLMTGNSGAQTVKVRMQTTGGSMTVTGGVNLPAYVLVEEISATV